MRYPLTTTLIALAGLAGLSAQEKVLTAADLLKYARDSITAASGSFDGYLLKDYQTDPFVADFSGNGVVYHFDNPRETIQARAGGQAPGNPTADVRGSNITMEDLSMSFLSWPATAVAEETVSGRKNYRVTVRNPSGKGAYAGANIWIDQKTLGLSKVEAHDRKSQVAKEIRIWNYKKHGEQFLPGKITITSRDAGKKQASTSIQILQQRS